LANGGRITVENIGEEMNRLRSKWRNISQTQYNPTRNAETLIGKEAADKLDYYDYIKLAGLVAVCKESKTMAEAGRRLLNVSRSEKRTANDTHRVKQLLQKYGLTFPKIG